MLLNKFFFLTLSVILTSVIAASTEQHSNTENMPPISKSRTPEIDIKNISIDLRFDWKKEQAYGIAAITFSPLKQTDRITLDAGMLTINSITAYTGASLDFQYDGGDKNDGLIISLDRVYQTNEEITITIDYHTNWVNRIDPNNLSGSNGKGLRFFYPTKAEPKKRKQIWSMGEPESNRYWFPGYDSPGDLRTTEFKATVDKDLTVISNGKLLETKANPEGTVTFHYKTDAPYANHNTLFAVGEYDNVIQNYDGITLNNFCYPDETEATVASVQRLPDMIKFFSETTGVKYPYDSYSQIFVQDLPWGVGGMMASINTENMVDDDRTHDDYFYLWDGLEGESLAQQWFGNYLMCSDWSDIWLNKSFARYFSGLYNEYKNGRDEFLLYQHAFDQSTYQFDWSSGNKQPVVNKNYENASDMTGSNYTYFHGASVLHMLRKHLGDEVWNRAIKLYVSSNGGKQVSTEDFLKAVNEASGESMDWFFEQWLFKIGHPVFEITKNYDDEKNQLTLNVKQTQQINPEGAGQQVEYFQGKVEIEVDGKVENVKIEPLYENIFTFSSADPPKLVNFDFESTWIKEIVFEKSIEELLYQFQNDKDITGRQWSMTELVNIAKDEKTSGEDKEKIYSAFRNLILSDSYWRLRFNALSQLAGLIAPATDNKPVQLDEATLSMLLTVIKKEKSWVRANAIRFLGLTQDMKYADIYIEAFGDVSDRVISSAAIALGKSKSPKAYDALVKLISKPSWKNQSLMSSLAGLKELGDPRGFDHAFNSLSDLNLSRWTLSTPPVWDFRVFAAQTIASLGRSDEAYPLIIDRFKTALDENDLSVIFNNALLIAILGDPRGQEAFDLLKIKYKDDANILQAVNDFEAQFKAAKSIGY